MYSIRNVDGSFVHRSKYPLVLLMAVWGVVRKYGITKTIALFALALILGHIFISTYAPKPLVYHAEAEAQLGRVVMIEEVIEWTPERIKKEIRDTFPEAPELMVRVA